MDQAIQKNEHGPKLDKRALLLVKYKEQVRHINLITKNEVSFGRNYSNDIKLILFPFTDKCFESASQDISRKHFVIRRRPDGYTIQDNNTVNGTSLNCIALLGKERYLKDGHIIDVGGVLDIKVLLQKDFLWLFRITNNHDESYLLFPKTITIGSSPNDTFTLIDDSIMPCHCEIKYQECDYWITKKHNAAIILVDNKKLGMNTPYRIRNNSYIYLGSNTVILFKTSRT